MFDFDSKKDSGSNFMGLLSATALTPITENDGAYTRPEKETDVDIAANKGDTRITLSAVPGSTVAKGDPIVRHYARWSFVAVTDKYIPGGLQVNVDTLGAWDSATAATALAWLNTKMGSALVDSEMTVTKTIVENGLDVTVDMSNSLVCNDQIVIQVRTPPVTPPEPVEPPVTK